MAPTSSSVAASPEPAGDEPSAPRDARDLLYEARPNVTEVSGASLATRLGLDVPAFDSCSRDENDRVSADQALAESMRISATPTFLLGLVQIDRTVKITRVLIGAQPLAQFTSELDDLLATTEHRSWLRPVSSPVR